MTIQEFIDALNGKFAKMFDGGGYTVSLDKPGAKYTRIVISLRGGNRSAYAFVDAAGNIYKTDGWKAPAKGVRSTLATVDIARVDPYGAWLYR